MSDPHDAIRRELGREFDEPRRFESIEFIGGRWDGEQVQYEVVTELPPLVLPWKGEQYELFDSRWEDGVEVLRYRPVRGELD